MKARKRLKGYGVWAIYKAEELTTAARRRVISDELLAKVRSELGQNSRWNIPEDPEQMTVTDGRGLLNTAGPDFYELNCQAFPEEYLETERLVAVVFQKLLRLKESDRKLPPPQFLAFIELWAGFNTLCAAANILRLGYPYESTTLLRSALLSAYQAIYYNDEPEVFESIKQGKAVNSKAAQKHAAKKLPQVKNDGIDDDHVGRMWGIFSSYVHATPALALRRAFSNEAQENFKLGPRSPRNPNDLPFFKEGIASLNYAAMTYSASIDHLFGTADPGLPRHFEDG